MADNELEDEMGDETGSESSLSSWNGSPSLSPQFTTTPELDQRRRKRRRIEHSEHCPEQGMQIEPVPSSQDQEAEAEEGESSLCHQSNNDHESSSASLSSLTPPPLSQPTHPSQEEEEDGFCSSASTEPYSPIKARKNVRFDESRNTVFGYDRGSAIMLSQASNDDRPSCSFEDDDEDQEEILDYGFDQNDIGYEEDGTSDNVMSSPSSSLTLPSRWAWSSMVMAGGSCEPIPSDLEAAVSPGTTRMLQSDRDSTKDTGALQGGTVEESGYSSSQSSQFSQETFLNIASSLDRLWSPSRTPLSTISGLKRSASSLSSTTSSSPLASTSRAPSGPHKLPVLKRQSSMSVIDNAESSESSGHETPHQQSPALLRRQGSFNKEAAPEDAKAVSSQPSEKLQIQAEKDDMAMQEEPPVDSLSKQVDRVRLMSPPLTGERRVVRGMVRNREGLGRTFAHPYKRRAPVDEDPSTVATGTTGAATAASSSSVSSTPFMPPRLARAASFSVARQPNNKPPMLRREASTTALMDTLS
ncbi:hypothetical protein BGX34_011551 [Mortierella sp. NVP85]|nr:hypothetical protein BGX34_011551 [Mortierella sp. NVP85]